MAKITIILLCCVMTTLTGKVPESSTKSLSGVKVEVVEDIKALLLKNPELIELKKESFQVAEQDQIHVIRYTIGLQHPAHVRLGESTNKYDYPTARDFALQITYPQIGIGGIIKFIEILVAQNSDIGSAYIIAGGLEERFIRIIVEAKQITHFHYRATFHGQLV